MAPPARPNLRQIAASLGLSVTTVSRALKEGPEVHPRTRARVQQAAAKAGYTPNVHGLALRTGRTRMIAAILQLETRAYMADLAKVPFIEGMTLAASENGYALSIFSTGPEEDQLWSLQRLVQSGISDGIIITRMVAKDPRIAFLKERSIPFVAFGRSETKPDYAYVDVDNEAMMREATTKLVAENHRRIALHLLTRDDETCEQRLRGYRQALTKANLPFDPVLVGYDEFTMAASEIFFESVLDLPKPATALMCSSELGLLGAIAALRKRGLVPGRDVGLFVRDNTRLSKYLAVPLLAHFVDLAQAGRLAVDALLRQIDDPGSPPTQIVMPGHFERYSER
ncbi:substrate-binding domain-containing protein [Mesorhizobium sp. VK24D]|uniref:Substrate-binding domain-containing protein n=1 Tax=Mesorhizobium album TaxID=3072314 RepID=A0ABU4Y3N6_9HYPH|nr:substrate-binding domain-containing protein [Mesorhizobium sp. VK24D]MDX8481557.1 substrate-binding domain-containing protein [Mesorhizobium sp. VK24D]